VTSSSIFLLQAFVIIAAPVVLLRVSGLKGLMPLVVVQIAVGIALGPSVFGRMAPEYFQMLMSPATLASLSGLAAVAVLIFGLISGLHLDPGVFSGNERTFWSVGAANIAVPMTLGWLAGWWILARHPNELLPGVNSVEFMAAIGICVSMNALPVLGAILGELGLLGSRIGNVALGLAGLNNVVLWMMLGVLLTAAASGRSGAGDGLLPPIAALALAPAYLILMARIVRPLLGEMLMARMQDEAINARALVVVGAAAIASALVTEIMGLHYIFGAFLVGAIIPRELRKPLLDRLQVMTVALLMPFFFVLTGMRILIDLSSPALLEAFAVTIGAAVLGIIGGTAAAARLNGEDWPFAFSLGSLLQSKGLTELIVLTILLDARIVSPKIFTAMILMALASTALTMPLARLALARSGERRPITEPMTLPSRHW
jgi:Kef-type K+ transport system membrane component KefB